MAVYVLLSFDDDGDAKAFIENIIKNVSVRGVFKQPTKFCECQNNSLGFTRGAKYGWWVCARCGYPSRGWANGSGAWYSALGINLLPNECIKPEWRHPTYSPKYMWDFLKPIIEE